MLPDFDAKYWVLFIIMAVGFITAQVFEEVPEYPKPRPLLALADAYNKTRQLDKAVALYKELIVNPNALTDPMAHTDFPGIYTWRDAAGNNLAGIYQAAGTKSNGLLDKAEDLYLSLNPTSHVITNLANIYLEEDRPHRALALLELYDDKCVIHGACLLAKARILDELGECNRAVELYERAKTMEPDLPKWRCK